jgi:hypothetical protein
MFMNMPCSPDPKFVQVTYHTRIHGVPETPVKVNIAKLYKEMNNIREWLVANCHDTLVSDTQVQNHLHKLQLVFDDCLALIQLNNGISPRIVDLNEVRPLKVDLFDDLAVFQVKFAACMEMRELEKKRRQPNAQVAKTSNTQNNRRPNCSMTGFWE